MPPVANFAYELDRISPAFGLEKPDLLDLEKADWSSGGS